MEIFFDKKFPFNRQPCRVDCAIFVEREINDQAFGRCGLLGPFLTNPGSGWDLPITGQHIYPGFYEGMKEGTAHE